MNFFNDPPSPSPLHPLVVPLKKHEHAHDKGNVIYILPTLLLPWVMYPHSDPRTKLSAPEAPHISPIEWVKISISSKELEAIRDLPITVI